jgi:hypothetical protein
MRHLIAIVRWHHESKQVALSLPTRQWRCDVRLWLRFVGTMALAGCRVEIFLLKLDLMYYWDRLFLGIFLYFYTLELFFIRSDHKIDTESTRTSSIAPTLFSRGGTSSSSSSDTMKTTSCTSSWPDGGELCPPYSRFIGTDRVYDLCDN